MVILYNPKLTCCPDARCLSCVKGRCPPSDPVWFYQPRCLEVRSVICHASPALWLKSPRAALCVSALSGTVDDNLSPVSQRRPALQDSPVESSCWLLVVQALDELLHWSDSHHCYNVNDRKSCYIDLGI